MKKTLTIYLFSLLSLFLVGCEDSFFKAIKNNKIKTVEKAQELIDKGADINYRDKEGNTLLHVVNSIEMAKFFLEKGLKVDAKNNKGETPLYTAIKRMYYDLALFLKKNGSYGFSKTNNKIKHPYGLAVQHLRAGNLSPEETELLEELLDMIWKENVHKH